MNASVSAATRVTVGSVMRTIPMMLVSLMAIGGNALVLASVVRTKSLHRVPGNMFVVNLAVTDALGSTFNMPLSYATVLLNGHWMFGSFLCYAAGFMAVFLSLLTILTLLGFSLYRCDTVISKRRRTDSELWRIVKRFITAAWIASIFLAFPPFLGWGRYEFIPNFSTCTVNWGSDISFSLTIIVLGFFIPQPLIAFSYFKIIRFVKTHNKRMTEASQKRRLNGKTPGTDVTSLATVIPDDSFCSETAVIGMPSDEFPKIVSTASTVVYVLPEPANLTTSVVIPTDSTLSPSRRVRFGQASDVSGASSISTLSLGSCDGRLPRRNSAPDSEKASDKPGPDSQQAAKSSNASKRILRQAKLTRVLITTVVAFQICWLPFAVDSLLRVFGYTGARVPYFELVAIWMAYSNTVFNPLIYALLNEQFRKAFRDTLAALCKPRRCC